MFFDDWRDVDGVKFPLQDAARDGQRRPTEEWTITKVKVNPKIDPKRFESES